MIDLYLSIFIMGFLALFIAILTSWALPCPCSQPKPGKQESEAELRDDYESKMTLTVATARVSGIVLVLSSIASVALLYLTKDRVMWARVMPFSNAIIWSNLTVLALAVAAGAAFRLPNRPLWRRCLSFTALLLLAFGALLQPVLQPLARPVAGGNTWDSMGVCIQTKQNTCSAAAASTLLKAHGVDVTEKEMAEFCLTDARGTPSLGLWRGLCLATRDTNVKPEVVTANAEELISSGPWPAVLCVGLPLRGADPVYVQRYGWAPGFRHAVVLFGTKQDGFLDIGDPAIGRESWSQEDLRILYRGEAIHLVTR